MFNNYFNDYVGLILIPIGKLPPKFTVLDIKFHGTKNPYHYLRNFVSAMALKGIDKDISYIIFPWTFNKDVMRWYNAVDLRKVMNWDNHHREFLHQQSYNAGLPITLKDLELIKQEAKEGFSEYLAI